MLIGALRFTLARLRVIRFWWPAAGTAQVILPTLSWATVGAFSVVRLVACIGRPGLLTRLALHGLSHRQTSLRFVTHLFQVVSSTIPCRQVTRIYQTLTTSASIQHLHSWIRRVLGSSEDHPGEGPMAVVSVLDLDYRSHQSRTTPTESPHRRC